MTTHEPGPEVSAPTLSPEPFNGRTIAIVGNGAHLFDRTDGADIDGHDLVVRFNLVWPSRSDRPECTGTRTTHMSVGGRHFKTPALAADLARVRAANPKVCFYSAKADPATWTLDSPVPLLPDEIYHGWRRAVGTDRYMPTAGSTTLFFLTRYCRPRSITLYGMNGLKSWSWVKNRSYDEIRVHSAQAEQAFLAQSLERHDFLTLVQ